MTAATPASGTSPIGAGLKPSPPIEPPARGPRAEIDLYAVVANWRTFQRLGGTAECAAVVKADAYGLGAEPVAKALAATGARTFFTATLGEALAVRRALGEGPTVVALNGPTPGDLRLHHDAGVTPVLNSLAQVALWQAAPTQSAVVHIDTGMNRLGLRPEEAGAAAALLADRPPALVMSHLACASDPAHPMNEAQRDRFRAAAAEFPNARRSLAASAGAQLGQGFAFDMIRPGVGLYGWDGMDAATTPLAVAARVTAPVIQRRLIRRGETCGYGASFTAAEDMEAVIVACGYADGFFRTAGGRVVVAYGQTPLPVLGRVSMDLLIVDARAASDLREGLEVELVGPTARAEALAAAAGTVAYEVFTTFVGKAQKIYSGG